MAVLLGGAVAVVQWQFPNAWFALQLAREPAPRALPSPVRGVPVTAIAPTWHAPRSGGRRHEGVDVFAPRGREVVATTHGIVWRVGVDSLGGNVVLVLGPGRELHYYAHLDRFASIARGDRVDAGSMLGYVGTTGNARGGPPHLHYGIYGIGGAALDPFPRLRRFAGAGTGDAS